MSAEISCERVETHKGTLITRWKLNKQLCALVMQVVGALALMVVLTALARSHTSARLLIED